MPASILTFSRSSYWLICHRIYVVLPAEIRLQGPQRARVRRVPPSARPSVVFTIPQMSSFGKGFLQIQFGIYASSAGRRGFVRRAHVSAQSKSQSAPKRRSFGSRSAGKRRIPGDLHLCAVRFFRQMPGFCRYTGRFPGGRNSAKKKIQECEAFFISETAQGQNPTCRGSGSVFCASLQPEKAKKKLTNRAVNFIIYTTL